MEIILATTNPSKAEQIKAMFKDPSIKILTSGEIGISDEAVEDGETLEENALKKARFVHNHLKNGDKEFWAMADDTGIFIDTLNGEPGIKSARWAGENIARENITEYCLKRMENVEDRSATFRTVAVIISPEGKEYVFNGEVKGSMLNYAKVKAQPRMPYSPLFMPEGTSKVLAEMTVEEENKISHRGRAFKQVVDFLESFSKK